MANVTIPYRFRVRRRTAASWTSLNEVLLDSEIGLESDTGKFKIGDGSTAWSSLKYTGWGRISTDPSNGQVPVWDSSLGLWVPSAQGGGGGGGGGRTYTDPPFANVSTLLHMDGSNGSTTFTDQVAGNTWTANNATISTAQVVFAGQAGRFTGTGNSAISMPTNSKFNVGSTNWALEFSIYPTGAHQGNARVFQTRNGDVVSGISLNFTTGQQLGLQLSSNGSSVDVLNATNIGSVVLSNVNRCILQRSGRSIEMFINGFSTYIGFISATASLYYNAADTIIIGGNATGTSRSINAYLDECRFTNGAAVVAPEVTFPPDPFPDS